MSKLKDFVRTHIDDRIRDSVYVLRTRRDATLLSSLLRAELNMRHPVLSDAVHLEAAIAWLCAAQDATADDGISAFYDTRTASWAPSYPETSGYIIPTFLNYARLRDDNRYRQRALRVADWLLTLQLANGSFPIGPLWADWERAPVVFDTGQIVHGLVSAYQESGAEQYLRAACRAGDWLVAIQEEDGSWRRFTSQGYVHTYNVRVAWALLRLATASGERAYRLAAQDNLAWALTQQCDDGWFHNAAFAPGEAPLTHTIAYTIRGLLESGLQLEDNRLLAAAASAANALKERQQQDGQLYARYGPRWQVAGASSCLTGNAQMAIIWLRLYQCTGETGDLQAAQMAIAYNKRTQSCRTNNAGIAGGIAGSYPVYGPYEPYRYLNWAAKFFADSLMLSQQIGQQQEAPSYSSMSSLPVAP